MSRGTALCTSASTTPTPFSPIRLRPLPQQRLTQHRQRRAPQCLQKGRQGLRRPACRPAGCAGSLSPATSPKGPRKIVPMCSCPPFAFSSPFCPAIHCTVRQRTHGRKRNRTRARPLLVDVESLCGSALPVACSHTGQAFLRRSLAHMETFSSFTFSSFLRVVSPSLRSGRSLCCFVSADTHAESASPWHSGGAHTHPLPPLHHQTDPSTSPPWPHCARRSSPPSLCAS